MAARLRYRPRFLQDFERHRDWLVEHGEAAWLDNLYSGLEVARSQIARFPAIGMVVRHDPGRVLRVWRYPGGVPYLLLYAHEPSQPIREVWLLRLFHYREDRSAGVLIPD